ncbi:hypothetical protein, unknown function [Leishmania tarentolae]|uniref:Leucine-rich repeat protein (LRRP) n=1 Tax=Leishmania tarentolae TaxID=5689 RepID=A0A640KQQ7_LEITA|nr:hypothetical protein, unknown function [Leishmania tarentolae]
MSVPVLVEIRHFHESGERSSLWKRRQLMYACLSPAARALGLMTIEGLTIGAVLFRQEETEMNITIVKDESPPPVGWWRFSGDVTVASHNAPWCACGVISVIRNAWCACRVRRVELTSDDDVDDVVQGQVLRTLCLLENDVVSLHLGKVYIKDDQLTRFLRRLNVLSLDGCDGRIEKWMGCLSKTAEVVKISDCFCVSEATLACMPAATVRHLTLDNTNVTASHLNHLKWTDYLQTLSLMDCRKIHSLQIGAFPELRRLFLCRTPIENESLKGVESCSHLRIVNLGGCQEVNDVNVLGALKQLRELFLHGTGVTDGGIAAIASCEGLEKLNLGGCISISDVNHLGRLANLLELHLWSTRVTNAGIRGLASCCAMVELILDDCVRITDVSPLGCLQSLRWLSLIGTEVDAHGVKALIQSQKLETLALGGTRIAHPPKLWSHEAIVEYLENFL